MTNQNLQSLTKNSNFMKLINERILDLREEKEKIERKILVANDAEKFVLEKSRRKIIEQILFNDRLKR